MKKAVLVLLAALCACGDNQDAPGARDLLGRVRAERYRTWARPPGWERRAPTAAPHSEDVDIYVNPEIEAALRETALEAWPTGSIAVKDGFSGNALEIIAVMEKREDGWFFAEYGEDGEPMFSGRPGVCLGCHVVDNDRILAFSLPR